VQWLKYSLALLSLVGLWFIGLGLTTFIPLPASLLGLLILLLGLIWLKRIPKALLTVSQFVLGHMLVLFIPATMGILIYAEKLADNLLWLIVSIAISTLISLGITAWICQRLWRSNDQNTSVSYDEK
jgi:holin-like protein